jgi:hypothetical protein
MSTRKLNHPTAGLIVGLVAGLLSQLTAATEEVVVNGTEAVALAQAEEVRFQTEMKDSVQSLNQNLKATLDKELKALPAPKLELALGELPTRG